MGGVEVQQRTVGQGVRKRLELALKRRTLNKERRERYLYSFDRWAKSQSVYEIGVMHFALVFNM
jgi:hypothetical protein